MVFLPARLTSNLNSLRKSGRIFSTRGSNTDPALKFKLDSISGEPNFNADFLLLTVKINKFRYILTGTLPIVSDLFGELRVRRNWPFLQELKCLDKGSIVRLSKWLAFFILSSIDLVKNSISSFAFLASSGFNSIVLVLASFALINSSKCFTSLWNLCFPSLFCNLKSFLLFSNEAASLEFLVVPRF